MAHGLRDFFKPGKFRFGEGKLSGYLAVILGALNVLGAVGFHFPQYLTSPDVRKTYDVDFIRTLMSVSIIVSIFCGCFTIYRGRFRRYGMLGISLTTLCLLMGGPFIPVADSQPKSPYVGLDWLVLDLLGSALVFIAIEKAFPYKKTQKVMRNEWGLDLLHFSVNHLLIGVTLLVTNTVANHAFGWMRITTVMNFVNSLWFPVELFLAILAADLIQYCTHRALHEIPFMWRIHAVHHCPESMDWLSGSRQHWIELFLTRTMVFIPLFVLGFKKELLDVYIIIVAFQGVFNHANVSLDFGFLENLIVTPQFHHWHHSSDAEAIDKNYAAHFSFIDSLFGTRVASKKEWPKKYGIVGKALPASYWAHMTYPFKSEFWKKEAPTPTKKRANGKRRQARSG